MRALRIVVLSMVAQAVAAACSYEENFCDTALCAEQCDFEAEACVGDGWAVVEASAARVRIAGPEAHVVFAGAELLVVLLDSEAPPIRLGRLSPRQREVVAGWLVTSATSRLLTEEAP